MLLLILGGTLFPEPLTPTGETVLMPAKAGPAYTREKHRKFMAELEAEREAERLELARLKQLEIDRVAAELRAARDRRIAELLSQANAAAAKASQLPLGIPSIPFMQPVSVPGELTAAEQDDEEALALLLLGSS